MRILIADDDFTSRNMLAVVLRKGGNEVVETDNGAAAWDALQQPDAPRLVILDWIMPEMDGLEILRRARAQPSPEPPYIIMLTIKGEKADIVAGLDAGADDYVSKPYDNEELRARVNVGMRMITMQDELREREKLKGVLEMSGAVCHELNQPLQSVLGYSELLLLDLAENDPKYQTMMKIKSGVLRMGELTRKIMNVTRYQSKPYLDKGRIIDIEHAS